MASVQKPRSRRFTVDWYMRAYHPQASVVTSRTINISATGIAFPSPARYTIGERIVMDLALGHTDLVRCVVQIVREQRTREGRYVYGARFEEFANDGRQILNDILAKMRRHDIDVEFANVPLTALRDKQSEIQ